MGFLSFFIPVYPVIVVCYAAAWRFRLGKVCSVSALTSRFLHSGKFRGWLSCVRCGRFMEIFVAGPVGFLVEGAV